MAELTMLLVVYPADDVRPIALARFNPIQQGFQSNSTRILKNRGMLEARYKAVNKTKASRIQKYGKYQGEIRNIQIRGKKFQKSKNILKESEHICGSNIFSSNGRQR